jgi:CRP-like cAMP-binding protein
VRVANAERARDPTPIGEDTRSGNSLLARLPREDRVRIDRRLERVSLDTDQVLYATDSLIKRVYFPTRGLISIMAEFENGKVLQVATVGPEGMLGISLFLDDYSSRQMAVGQIAGECLVMSAAAFDDSVAESPAFRALIRRYSNAYMSLLAHAAACNGAHRTAHRLARWLLTCRDAAGSDQFTITHELLATTLGVQRPAVSLVAERLSAEGAISYRRGRVRVLDPRRIEEHACECYAKIREEYDELLS